jgi:hypothetical protein
LVTSGNVAEASGRALDVRDNRKINLGNLRSTLARNSEETGLFPIVNHTRRSELAGPLISLHEKNHANIGHKAKLARTHEEDVKEPPAYWYL